jgi:hypothetical protein
MVQVCNSKRPFSWLPEIAEPEPSVLRSADIAGKAAVIFDIIADRHSWKFDISFASLPKCSD